jgi:hypothetical protein
MEYRSYNFKKVYSIDETENYMSRACSKHGNLKITFKILFGSTENNMEN